MIARTLLSLITEAYSDEFLSYYSKKYPEYAEGWLALVDRAKHIFKKPNQLNWFLRLAKQFDNDGSNYYSVKRYLDRFEHFFSLPIESIHNFNFGSIEEYEDALDKLQGLEAKWQERQSRLIPMDKAYRGESHVIERDEYYDYGDEDDDEKEYAKEISGEPEDIVTFPDGFRWVNLNIPYSEIEANAMGHCGNEPRQDTKDTILSLRQLVKQGDKEYLMPHATFVLMSNGYLRELKGFQNHKLASKYMRYVVELFKQYHWIKGIDNEDSYRPESDVTWGDFTREQLQDILRSNPGIKDEWVRYLATGEDGIYRTKNGYTQVLDNGNQIKIRNGKSTKFFNRGKELHRDDGPAVILHDNDNSILYTEWWRNGKKHREDGPAVEGRYESKEWWVNGKRHREDGPAIESLDGSKEWYRNGVHHRDDGPAVITSSGDRYWYRNGQPHREDGPATEYSNGSKSWFYNGKYHREDGPAMERTYGGNQKEWWVNDLRHREDGPAIVNDYGRAEWYRDGMRYDPTPEQEEEHRKTVNAERLA